MRFGLRPGGVTSLEKFPLNGEIAKVKNESMSFIQERDKPEIQRIFSGMQESVELIIFTDTNGCQYCAETQQLLEEVSALSEKIILTMYSLTDDREKAEAYRVDKAPGLVITAGKDFGIRYYGIPSGYEFGSLPEDIMDVSRGEAGFTEELARNVALIRSPLHLQVCVTPAWPYCPSAVRNAHRLAIANTHVRADMIEATEFPELSRKYGVRGVPRTIVNDGFHIDGGLPEDVFIHQMIEHVQTQTGATTQE